MAPDSRVHLKTIFRYIHLLGTSVAHSSEKPHGMDSVAGQNLGTIAVSAVPWSSVGFPKSGYYFQLLLFSWSSSTAWLGDKHPSLTYQILLSLNHKAETISVKLVDKYNLKRVCLSFGEWDSRKLQKKLPFSGTPPLTSYFIDLFLKTSLTHSVAWVLLRGIGLGSHHKPTFQTAPNSIRLPRHIVVP